MRRLRQLLMSVVLCRDAIYCVLMNRTIPPLARACSSCLLSSTSLQLVSLQLLTTYQHSVEKTTLLFIIVVSKFLFFLLENLIKYPNFAHNFSL